MIRELDNLAGAIECIEVAPHDDDEVSFFFDTDLRRSLEEALARLRHALESLHETVAHYAVVRSGSLAVTYVDWNGSLHCCWRTGVSMESAGAHWQSLAVALETRARLLRILWGALKIAAAISAAAALSTGWLGALLAARKLAAALDEVLELVASR